MTLVRDLILDVDIGEQIDAGSLPDWWTVDSTPGGENVQFNGAVVVRSPEDAGGPLSVEIADGPNAGLGMNMDSDGLLVYNPDGQLFKVSPAGGVTIAPSDGDTIAAVIKSHADWQEGEAAGDMLDFQDENGALMAGFYRHQGNDSRWFFMYDDAAGEIGAFFGSRGYYQTVRDGETQNPILITNEDGSVDKFKVGPTGAVTISPSGAPVDEDDFGLTLVSRSIPWVDGLVSWPHQGFGRPGVDNDVNYENSPGGPSSDIAIYTTEYPGVSSAPVIALNRRRGSDEAITVHSAFTSGGFYSDKIDPDTGIYSDYVSMDCAYYGFYGAGPNGGKLLVAAGFVDYEVTVKILETNPAGGVARFGAFGVTPAVRPTGVAVTAEGIHAALVTLGWIAA